MLDAATIQALAGFLAVLVAVIGLLAGFVYWHIRDLKHDFRSESHRLDDKIDRTREELRTEIRQAREEMKEEIRQAREENRADIQRLEAKIDRNQAELLAEIRRSNAQLLAALNGHMHDTDTGAAVFREVPTAADDD